MKNKVIPDAGSVRHVGDASSVGNSTLGTHRPRQGFTLVELLVTLTLVAAMTGTAVKILATLLRSERTGIEHLTRLTTISRLSRHFRTDVHGATDFQLAKTPQEPLLRITSGDQRQIQYQVHAEGLLRTEQRPSQPVNSHDLLRLKGSRFRIVETSAPTRLLTLILETPDEFAIDAKQPAGPARELHVEAVVGRDYRDH